MPDELDNFDKRLRMFSESLEGLSESRLEILKSADGVIGKILVGHLIAEELLTICLEVRCSNYEHLENARLRFYQKVNLVRAFDRVPEITEDFWPLLFKLNALRNNLSHDIEQTKVEKLSAEFITLVLAAQKRSAKLAKKFGTEKPVFIDEDAEDALYQALHYTLGGLHMITVWTNHLDEMMSRKVTS